MSKIAEDDIDWKLISMFLMRSMENFINEIRMASYPQTADETGGKGYTEMVRILDSLDTLVKDGEFNNDKEY